MRYISVHTHTDVIDNDIEILGTHYFFSHIWFMNIRFGVQSLKIGIWWRYRNGDHQIKIKKENYEM